MQRMAASNALKMDDILSKLQDLPSLPHVVLKVYQLADDPQTNAAQLSLIIGKDHGFAARLLRMANSPYYGMSRRIGSIDQAVMVLGCRTVKSLSLLAGTFPFLSKTLPGYTVEPSALWRHSLATAIIAQGLCSKVGANPDETFAAALLHDMGKLVIAAYAPKAGEEACKKAIKEGVSFHQAEKTLWGFTHAELGEAVCKMWALPDTIQDAVGMHHEPSAPPSPIVAIVHVSDWLATKCGFPLNEQEPIDEEPIERCMAVLGLTNANLAEALESASARIAESDDLFFEDEAA